MLATAVVTTDDAEPVAVRVLLNRFHEASVITHGVIAVEASDSLFYDLLLRAAVVVLNCCEIAGTTLIFGNHNLSLLSCHHVLLF